MPKDDDGKYRISAQPLRCQACGEKGVPELPARSERARDMTVSCRTCKGIIAQRLTARCPACAKELEGTFGEPRDEKNGNTPVARVVMRLANYRANDAYYPHTLTILRLDRPEVITRADDETELLRSLLPADRRPGGQTATSRLGELVRRMAEAEARGDQNEVDRLGAQLVDAATRDPKKVPKAAHGLVNAPEIVLRSLEESLAFKQSVSVREAGEVVTTSDSASTLLVNEIAEQQKRLGIRRVALVDDLPIITATFGYTRRTFNETYDEESLGATGLPTQLRPFYPLDRTAARRLGRADLAGTIPFLAREGEHEGIFLAFDPQRVVEWLGRNGVALGDESQPAVSRITTALEGVDRYYDRIWDTRVHRYVFGLIHSLSHAAMRVVSRLAGLDRTSVGEYLFLPLLGVVVYSNAAATRLGNMETVIRDHLLELLTTLPEEGLACLYDPDCLDRRGACHGCLHAPEICCRVFNHGLSRSFIQGGHAPWVDPAIDTQISGYW
jgi:hypothetical protein